MLNIDADLYGSNRVFFQVAQTLQEEGHEILIFLPRSGSLTELFREFNLEYKFLNLGVNRRKYYNPQGIVNRFSRFIQAYRVLKKEAIHWRADTIYTNTILIWVGLVVARRLKLSHFWHLHEILEQGIPKRIFGFFLSRNNDTFICVSKAVIGCWKDYFKQKSQTHLLYNGVVKPVYNETNILRKEIPLSQDSVIIGLIGRINLIKGQSYFIEIAREINKTQKNIEFMIVGDPYPGNEYLVDELKKKIADYGLLNVHLLGFRKDIGNIIHSLDILILASVKDDSFPLVILEAMSSGLPVVATNQGGAKEMLEDDKSGIFIPLNNAVIAAEKIKPLLNDVEKRKEMGKHACTFVNKHFSEKSFRDNLKLIFQ